MIILNILLVFIVWLLILWLFWQYKHINIFEQIALWFWIAISLFVFELFLSWIIFNKLNLILPIITFLSLLMLFIYFSIKNKIHKDIVLSIKNDFLIIKSSFYNSSIIKKLTLILLTILVLFKILMSFWINTSMPTFDEDSVTWWDLKTKVFFENKNLVLDNNNVEFLWSALERNIFAPITDVYFILWYNEFPTGLSNIISPLIYLCIIILLFWIFLRKTNLLYWVISIYIFTSLPFVFIHSTWSYFNFISWFFLFSFAFYLSDQVLKIDSLEINKKIIIPLWILGFLDSTIRNESFILMLSIFIMEISVYLYYKKEKINIKNILLVFLSLIWLIVSFIVTKYVHYISPEKVADISNNFSGWVLERLLNNISQEWVLMAPLNQVLFHSDYNLLYLVFFICLIIFIFNFKKLKEIRSILFSTILLLSIFCLILYANVEVLWLLTHFSFIRYSIAIIPFIVFFVTYIIYFTLGKNEN
jgi:hypothetical protein